MEKEKKGNVGGQLNEKMENSRPHWEGQQGSWCLQVLLDPYPFTPEAPEKGWAAQRTWHCV